MRPSVWSNVAFPLPALLMWGEWSAFTVMLVAGIFMMLASGLFHATLERFWQRMDVAMVHVYIASLLAVVLSTWTPWGYVLPIAALLFYTSFAWQIDSRVHVPAWSVVTLIALAVQAGAWALIPAALLGLAAYVGTRGGVSSLHHSAWHVLSAGAAASVLLLV